MLEIRVCKPHDLHNGLLRAGTEHLVSVNWNRHDFPRNRVTEMRMASSLALENPSVGTRDIGHLSSGFVLHTATCIISEGAKLLLSSDATSR